MYYFIIFPLFLVEVNSFFKIRNPGPEWFGVSMWRGMSVFFSLIVSHHYMVTIRSQHELRQERDLSPSPQEIDGKMGHAET